MPVCPICKGEDFELFNGHYFCNECSTQSQEIREEEGDEDTILQSAKFLRVVQGKRASSEGKKHQDKSTVWFSCEAYNIILNRQVEALIKMGASPELKNVVMELWFNYLKVCEVAFVSDKDDWTPRLSSFPSCRDISVLEGKNPTSSKSVKRRKRDRYQVLDGKRIYAKDKRKEKKSKKKKQSDDTEKKKKKKSSDPEQSNNEAVITKKKKKKKKESLDLEQPNSKAIKEKKKRKKTSDPEEPDAENSNDEAITQKTKKKRKKSADLEQPNNEALILKKRKKKKSSDLETPNDESTVPVVDEAESKSNPPKKKRGLTDLKNYSKFARNKIRTVGTKDIWGKLSAENCVDRMTLTKTICFCYAGLLLLQEQILLSDIIRWIHECHIPYLNAYRVLPESMILRHTDITGLKKARIPQGRSIIRESSRLLVFLEKREIPQQPVCQVALRYIMDLNLPNEMAIVIHQLVNVQRPTLSSTLNAPVVLKNKKFMPYYDVQAGALVLVVLKIVFGLNGKRERELSTIARELNSDSQAERQTFVWDDWQEHMSLKLNRQKILNVTASNYSVKESWDVKALHSFWKEIKITPADAKNIKVTNERVMEQKRAIPKAFSSLPNMSQKSFSYRPSSFPISVSTAEYVSQEFEVAHFLRDYSTYALPRMSSEKKPSHRYWEFPSLDGVISRTAEFLDKLPQSFQVLVHAVCYTTNSLAADLLTEAKKIETLVFKKTPTPLPDAKVVN